MIPTAPVKSIGPRIIYICVGLALVAALSVLGLLVYHYWEPLYARGHQVVLFCTDKERLRIWLESWGPLAPLIFILVQTFQIMTPIPGEVTGFVGGYLFGVTAGFLYSTLGITLGASLVFSLSRSLEISLVEKWVKKETLERFDYFIEREGALAAFLVFLTPGAPKRSLCVILGLSRMPFKVFLLLVFLGRMPATFLVTLQGAQVYQGNYLTFLIMVVFLFIVAGVLLLYRERFYQWLRKWGGNPQA